VRLGAHNSLRNASECRHRFPRYGIRLKEGRGLCSKERLRKSLSPMRPMMRIASAKRAPAKAPRLSFQTNPSSDQIAARQTSLQATPPRRCFSKFKQFRRTTTRYETRPRARAPCFRAPLAKLAFADAVRVCWTVQFVLKSNHAQTPSENGQLFGGLPVCEQCSADRKRISLGINNNDRGVPGGEYQQDCCCDGNMPWRQHRCEVADQAARGIF
jgi:hypothetical protein